MAATELPSITAAAAVPVAAVELEPEAALPSRTDAVVVGGGIIGLSAALHLLRTGRTVAVVEQAGVAHGASGHNAGVVARGECVPLASGSVLRAVPRMLTDPLSALAIRWTYLPRLTPWLLRFMKSGRAADVERISVALQSLTLRSVEAYRELLGEASFPTLIHQTGILHAYRDAATARSARAAHELRARRGVRMQELDDAGITALDPALHGRFSSAVYMPDVASTPDPHTLTAAIAAKFVAEGGRLVQAEAKDFTRRAGRVESLRTANAQLTADTVVIAAGAWSRRLARALRVDVPLDTERGYGVVLPAAGLQLSLPVVIEDFHFAVRTVGDETRLVGISELGGLQAPPDPQLWTRVLKAAQIVFPELRVAEPRKWMSFRPSMPDSLPVIDRAPGHRNVILAFGHGHKGLGLGAITGKLVTELADGRDSSVDLTPFAATRFRRTSRSAAQRVA